MYDRAKNGLLCGWAIVVAALILNAASFLVFRDPVYVLGAALCFATWGAAYLGEMAFTGSLPFVPVTPTLLMVLFGAVVVLPCAAWAVWIGASWGVR